MSLSIGDVFGYKNFITTRAGRFYTTSIRCYTITSNRLGWFPIFFGQLAGAGRIRVALDSHVSATVAWRVAQAIRGLFEVLGVGVVFALIDIPVTLARGNTEAGIEPENIRRVRRINRGGMEELQAVYFGEKRTFENMGRI